MSSVDPKAPLLDNISQYDVDFVIPRVGIDVPVGIDPFLLFKSRDPDYRDLHALLIDTFNIGIDAIRSGKTSVARRLLDFPEVSAIGLGYTRRSKRGSGVGSHLSKLIVETLAASPALQERGVRHVEEMQLVSAGIGPDRVSDITANILKQFLIKYTQRQCAIWEIPLKSGVPVQHIYDPEEQQWNDSFEDLPISPVDETPIILVPRRIVRALPWINYDDFFRTEFSSYLKARRLGFSAGGPEQGWGKVPSSQSRRDKEAVVSITRSDIGLVERYVRAREQESAMAQPAMEYIDEDACKASEALKQKLTSMPPGRENASEYQKLVLEILNFLFNPDLIDGQPEVRTIAGTERRDIIFTNDSDETFWEYVRTAHDGILLMFEAKNTNELGLDEINQTSTYLGDRIGRLGFIVTRVTPGVNIQKKIFSIWNDSGPQRKIILTLSDDQLHELLDLRCAGQSPTKWMQKHYRAFRTSVQ